MELYLQDYGNLDKASYMDHFYGIYGIGAVGIILFSQYFKKNNFTLFLEGYVIGTIVEYMISFLVEVFVHTKWWNYSNNILNINGRVCLLYSIFWGVLTLFLIRIVHPFMERMIKKITEKIPSKLTKGFLIFMFLFFIFDCTVTCYAQDAFISRVTIKNNIEVKDLERRKREDQKIQENQFLSKIVNTFWNDEIMIKTFPNIKIQDVNDQIIYLDSLLPNIQPYYIKFFEKQK